MDAFHQSRRLMGPPLAGDPPLAPPQQSPYWYPSSSPPPPPPGGYHHHQPPPYPSPPQWNQPGDGLHFPHHPPPYPQQQQPPPVQNPYPPPPSYHSHPPGGPFSAPPLRYPPPPLHPSAYPSPNQAWGNSSWGQHQGWEHPERNTPFSHEDDWAARAKAWADAKPAAEYHHTPSQFTPIGRTDEHNYAYNDQHQQVVGTPMDAQRSFPQSSNHHLSDFRKQDSSHEMTSFNSGSSFRTDGHVLHNAGVEAITSNAAHMSSPQKSYGPSPSIYEQEVPYIYSSRTGNREAVDHNENSRTHLPLPGSSIQGLYSQTTLSAEQPHYIHGGQSSKPLIDPSDLPLDFEPRSGSVRETHPKNSYGHTVPLGPVGAMDGGAIATSVHAWNSSSASGSVFPLSSTGTQFDTSYVSHPPLPVHTVPPFGGVLGPNFQSPNPPASAPFGLATGTSVHHSLVFPGDGNGAFNLSERPKKAAVPNWLREEIIKKTSTLPTHPSESSFHSVGSEDADNSTRTANQADNKSIDSTKSTEDEEDDEDNLEAARSAAINQEIKRVLTEVLLKVTDELFDEIATKVLNEDDVSVEVNESAVVNQKVSPPPPAVPTPKASARVLVQVKKNGINTNGASDNSKRSSPRGDILGLANYASDDDDDGETESSTLRSSGVIVDASRQLESNASQQQNILKEVDRENTPRSTDNLQKALKDVSEIREERHSVERGKVNEVLVQNATSSKPKGKMLESTSKTANNGKSNTEDRVSIESKANVSTSAYLEKNTDRDSNKEVKTGKDRTGYKTSDASDSKIHEERNEMRRKVDKRDYPKERFNDRDVKKGAIERDLNSRSSSKHGSSKDGNKETSKDKREKVRKDDDRKREQTRDGKEDRSARVLADSFRHSSTRSSSPSSRGRKSKQNSSGGHGSASSDEPYVNSRKRKLSSDRRNLSPSPTRSTKRQVSRSPHRKHSHHRHSPYSSTDKRRKSRSRSPVRHRSSSHKHDK